MRKRRTIRAVIAFALVIALLGTSMPFRIVSAAVGEDISLSKQYLKEVKMFYGRSESEARTACEKEGFTFCSADLNEGSPNVVIPDYERNTDPSAPLRIYLGYKTTENVGNAITDLTLLDMKNTHYEEVDYQKFLDEHMAEFQNEAAQMMVLVNELDRKINAGSPNALMAYDSLNLIYVDDKQSVNAAENQLGYYLIHSANIAFFEKLIQRGNAMILGKITKLLCSAAADYNADGTTWVDRAKTSEIAYEYATGTSEKKNMYDLICEDPAKSFVKAIRSFKNTYTEAKQRFDTYGELLGYAELEGMTEENGAEKLAAAGTDCRYPEYVEALKNYALLDTIMYHKAGETVVNNAGLLQEDDPEDGEEKQQITETYTKDLTLAQYIMELANDATLEDHLSTVYPIVHALTPAQRTALKLGGLSAIIEGLFQSNDYVSKRSEAIQEATNKLKESGCKEGRLYLWSGTDNSVYSKKVVKTNALTEAEAAGVDLDQSLGEAARKEHSTLNQTLLIVDLATLGYGGIISIACVVLKSTLWTIGTNMIATAGLNLASGLISLGGMIGSYVLGGLLCAMWVLNVLSIVVGFVMLIYSILQWTGALDKKERIDFKGIPDIVFDARKNEKGAYSVRYDAAYSNADKETLIGTPPSDIAENVITTHHINIEGISKEHADINAFQSVYDRWVTLYYSKAPAAGEPIEVIKGREPFITKNDYQVPEGYRPLSLITSNTAENVNNAEVLNQDEKKGRPALYVFFTGKYSGKGGGGETSDNGRYVTSVRFSHSKNMQDAINLLKKEQYTYIDVNLTPYDGYTYIGYQLGSEVNAMTDIRISNCGAEAIVYGDASYAKMGGKDKKNTGTTPDGFSLYATAAKSAGTPIVGISVEKKRREKGDGMEPVCLFSGGDAVDVGTKWGDNILECGEDSNVEFFLLRGGWTTYRYSKKDYSHEFISEDDPSNGIYIYFQPKEQFHAEDKEGKPAQRYVAGFSYFLAGDKETSDKRFGTNYEFMQTFAKENGFELLQENGSPFRVMSESAGEMTMGTTWRDVGGYPVDTYNFDQYHSLVQGNRVVANGDGGLAYGLMNGTAQYVRQYLTRDHNDKLIFHTAMYFGVAYTYNPYRAITGILGLVTPYTETTAQLKYGGMQTPAGSFQACNVSMQGCPSNSAGITAGYFNPNTMSFALYTNYDARQKSDLFWMTKEETEVLTHYLLTAGPRNGVKPLMEEDIAFRMTEKPGQMPGYVPLCDLRTPGDYEHPMNLALDTTNKGSKYLYLYLKNTAGGREDGSVTSNDYRPKKYVAAVFCGVGRNPEAAIRDLYRSASSSWATVASKNPDISATPLATEFDEIIPVDLSSEHPWYELHTNSTDIKSLKNGVWVRGNEMAYIRWEGHDRVDDEDIDKYEKDLKCAYVGVVRTAIDTEAARGLLKYYTNEQKPSPTLSVGGTECHLAGGPVNSPEGSYFLYYSTNSGTASYRAPITGLEISNDIFINGYNTVFTVSESDRVNSELPKYGQLRMRTDEYKYIHIGYDRADLPYYEKLYLGVGKTREEAFTDMIGTTNAYGAMDVNCNYNSFSNQWIAIGYRRTNEKTNAISDIFLYQGDNPPDQIKIQGGYSGKSTGRGKNKKFVFEDYKVENAEGVPYKLLKHNLKSGAEIISLNQGNGGPGIYLYYTTAKFYLEKSLESEVMPITNICCAYGDISPRHASTSELAPVFKRTYYGKMIFDESDYENPVWECVLGVEGSPENWKLSGAGASRFSLNRGVRPGIGGNGWEGSDNRVYMYTDRADSSANTVYQVRKNGRLPEFGYYSAQSTFGLLKQGE